MMKVLCQFCKNAKRKGYEFKFVKKYFHSNVKIILFRSRTVNTWSSQTNDKVNQLSLSSFTNKLYSCSSNTAFFQIIKLKLLLPQEPGQDSYRKLYFDMDNNGLCFGLCPYYCF